MAGRTIGIDHETLYTDISPQMAEAILDRNTRNRPLRPGVVERYARDMKNGDWMKNGAPITIDKNGAVHNGQHRLWAVIESETTQPFILLTGLDPETVMTVDNGASRSYSDYRQIKAKSETGDPLPYPNETQATLRWLYWYDNQWPALSRSQAGGKGVATFAELDDLQAKYPEVLEAVPIVCASNKISRIARRASMSFVMTMALRYNRELAERFAEVLRSGRESYEGDPAITLRERLTAAKLTGEKLDMMTELVFIIKAWNSFAAQKTLKSVRWQQDEVMPAIIGTQHAGKATSRQRLQVRTKEIIAERQATGMTKASLGTRTKKRGRVAGKRYKQETP